MSELDGGPRKSIPSVFVDRVANIGFSGGVVRIDFAQVSTRVEAGKGQAPLERNLRVITTLEGLVAAHQTMSRLIEQLGAQGKLAIARPSAPAPTRTSESE